MSHRSSPDATAAGPPTTSRGRRVLAGITAAAVAATTGVLFAAPASAAVPAFPDNITIFPNRDFVSIDGFASHAGQPVTVELVRGATVIGSANGTMADKAAIDAGNPAIEVNHPGGICWGANGGIQATPDILPGDQVVVKFGGTAAADATTLSPEVTDWVLDGAGTTLTVNGRFGGDVNPDFIEQRIINPDLRNTDVAFRDVRAVVGPLTPDRRSPAAYSSGITVDAANHKFVATYVFADPATAKIAQAGGMRAMSWQNLDAAANRQGVTIEEFGELGGPGFGGCPAAAATQGPASPTGVTAKDGATANTTDVTWKVPTVTPGGSAILGYTVRAVSRTSTAGGQAEVGKRISDPAATSTALPVGLAGNTVEVRSFTAAGESWPPALANINAGTGPVDTVAPTVAADPVGGTFTADVSVKLSSNDPAASIVYTLDGSDPLIGTLENPNATNYSGPIAIAAKDAAGNFVAPVTVRYVAFDAAGNPSLAKSETYTFGTATAPSAPTGVKATPGNTTAEVTWTGSTAGTSPVTGYTITPTSTSPGAALPTAVKVLSSATTATLTGLTNGATYTVSVVANSTAGDSPAGTATVTPNPSETLTVTSLVNKAGDLRIKGTSNAPSGTVSLFRADAAGNPTGAVLATSPLTAAAPPAVGSTFDLRARITIGAGAKLVITGTNGGKVTTST